MLPQAKGIIAATILILFVGSNLGTAYFSYQYGKKSVQINSLEVEKADHIEKAERANELQKENNEVVEQHNETETKVEYKTRVIEKKVIQYVPKTDTCDLPADFVRLLNCAVQVQNNDPDKYQCGAFFTEGMPEVTLPEK